MAVSTGLRGTSGFFLTFKTSAGSVTQVSDDCSKHELVPEDADGDDITFAEAAAGLAAAWTLKLTALISADAASLWSYLWANAGADVTFDYGPFGNAAATATKPHFTGTLNLGNKPPLSNEAGTDKRKRSYFDKEFDVVGDVTKVTA